MWYIYDRPTPAAEEKRQDVGGRKKTIGESNEERVNRLIDQIQDYRGRGCRCICRL